MKIEVSEDGNAQGRAFEFRMHVGDETTLTTYQMPMDRGGLYRLPGRNYKEEFVLYMKPGAYRCDIREMSGGILYRFTANFEPSLDFHSVEFLFMGLKYQLEYRVLMWKEEFERGEEGTALFRAKD